MDIKSQMTPEDRKSLHKTLFTRLSMFPVFLGLAVLVPAGTFNYWQLYAYLLTVTIPMLFVLFYFLKHDPQFLVRRMKTKEKEKAQSLIQITFSVFFLAGYIISGLDHRYGWSDIPEIYVLLTDLIIFLGYLIVFIVFKQNSFAARVVEVEKNQELITTGLYGIVRHPMYIGVLLMFVPTPLALGSWWGLIPMATVPFALVFRILNEEKVLKRDLPGYVDYCNKTRYRLVPGVW